LVDDDVILNGSLIRVFFFGVLLKNKYFFVFLRAPQVSREDVEKLAIRVIR